MALRKLRLRVLGHSLLPEPLYVEADRDTEDLGLPVIPAKGLSGIVPTGVSFQVKESRVNHTHNTPGLVQYNGKIARILRRWKKTPNLARGQGSPVDLARKSKRERRDSE